MKVRIFALGLVSLMFVSLIVLGIPVSGFAGTPHACPNNSHQAYNLGGVDEKDFVFVKNCGTETSAAVRWRFFVYNNDTGALIDSCQWGTYTLPPNIQTKHCGSSTSRLPHGDYDIIKVVINWWTVPVGGSMMTHTNFFSNTP